MPTDTDDNYYLAYGSNLHPLRLQLRLPGSRLLARVALSGCRLCFHKRGRDGSGKCNLVMGQPGAQSYGALYRLAPGEQEALDVWEGGYDRRWVRIALQEKTLWALTYLAPPSNQDEGLKPFAWYRNLVQAGAEHLGCPSDYLEGLKRVSSRADPDRQQAAHHQRLVTQLQAYNRLQPGAGLMDEAILLEWAF